MFGLIVSLVTFLCNTLWFLSQFAIFLIHYFFVLLILLCVVSKFIKLKAVPFESIEKIFSPSSFPIAHLGSIFDAPENSKASFEYVSTSSPIDFIDFLLRFWFSSLRAVRTTAREYSSALTLQLMANWSFWTSRHWSEPKSTSTSTR